MSTRTQRQPHRHGQLGGHANLCLDGPTQAKITTATGTGEEHRPRRRGADTGMKPAFRDTEDPDTSTHTRICAVMGPQGCTWTPVEMWDTPPRL